ncbi:MAG: universal stress protein [Methanothrix sp.]|jgi:Universal stress protein UspA and related nucleotide-binding proteins|uniref:Universal stress protein n=1 Tax=Methanothrix harundinacea TaxID=301375 RepID=A0A117LG68_9EURY|nr:MAG: Universal stress protein [Methanothrix harundinacea]MDD2638162.1 universal stress protein [Methanothrix sp.]MDI9398235.1 universal stress protein [Euryarchaeota archaeon]KUK97177.1 MAG: Universal stress protein [Methanothrix harundinacea]MCP1391491.1 universal stress protein [Methanothrix harundinacea]
MYRKILIATDGSDRSMKSSRHGVKLAKSLGSDVLVLHVINEMAISKVIASLLRKGTSEEDLRETLKASAERIVAEVAKMGEASGVRVEPLIREGDPASRILDAARVENVDLILMGSHGEGGITKRLIGSVAQKVLNWSDAPVMIVR